MSRIPTYRLTLSAFCALAALAFAAPGECRAATPNGNDLALYYTEAETDAEKADLLETAKGRPHFFRYLQIMEMEEVTEAGRTQVHITAFEPASYMDVRFTINQPVSLSVLTESPATKVGDALAVTGQVTDIDPEKNAIILGQTIVRHKDRLSPKMGKELLGEVDPGAVFYSYTAGKRPVNLSYRDRDLLKFRDKIVAESGPDGWVEFLESEVAKRKAAAGGK